MENKFLNRVSELIDDKKARVLINAELESHLLDKIDYYTEIGYTDEEAQKKATEEMGSPDDTAVPLSSLYENRGYNDTWSFITAIFSVVIALLSFNVIPIEHLFRYGDASFSIVHSVSIDFLSLLICAAYLLLIHKAHRQKNIASAVLIAISLLVMAVAYFPDMRHPAFQFSLFQPLLYPAVVISKYGFSGFLDSIFGYSYIPDSDRAFYQFGAIALYLILLAMAVTLLIAIFRQRRMKAARILWQSIKIAKPALCVLLIIDLFVMSLTTIPALASLDAKRYEMQTAKEKAIDYVINADLSKGVKPFINELLNDGYEYYYSEDNIWQDGQKTLHCGFNDSVIIANDFEDSSFVSYALIDFDRSVALTRGDFCLTDEEQEQIKINMTLEEFMALGFYNKAAIVSKEFYWEDEYDCFSIDFRFDLPDIWASEGFSDYRCYFEYSIEDKKLHLTSAECVWY